MASIIFKRLQEGIDRKLQGTQFGFRKDRGKADALQCVRNALTQSRGIDHDKTVALLDWEKTFDEVTHEALFLTLERMSVNNKK